MRVGATADFARSTTAHPRGTSRARLALLSILAMLAGLLAAAGGAAPASAVQASGHDAVAWATNWSWTYATTFNYNDGAGTNVNLNETVTYKDLGIVSFEGQDAYRMQISGTVDSGSGSAAVDGQQRHPQELLRHRVRHPPRPRLRPGAAPGVAAAAHRRRRPRSASSPSASRPTST